MCCGVDGPYDWTMNSAFIATLPPSCCMKMQDPCGIGSPDVNKDGCFEKLKMRVQNGATILIGVGIGIAFVEVSTIDNNYY